MGSHAMANFAASRPSDDTGLRVIADKLSFMPEHLPDRVDRAIVTRLQQDGRIANVDLADAVSLSPSACLRRVKALEASGIIARGEDGSVSVRDDARFSELALED